MRLRKSNGFLMLSKRLVPWRNLHELFWRIRNGWSSKAVATEVFSDTVEMDGSLMRSRWLVFWWGRMTDVFCGTFAMDGFLMLSRRMVLWCSRHGSLSDALVTEVFSDTVESVPTDMSSNTMAMVGSLMWSRRLDFWLSCMPDILSNAFAMDLMSRWMVLWCRRLSDALFSETVELDATDCSRSRICFLERSRWMVGWWGRFADVLSADVFSDTVEKDVSDAVETDVSDADATDGSSLIRSSRSVLQAGRDWYFLLVLLQDGWDGYFLLLPLQDGWDGYLSNAVRLDGSLMRLRRMLFWCGRGGYFSDAVEADGSLLRKRIFLCCSWGE